MFKYMFITLVPTCQAFCEAYNAINNNETYHYNNNTNVSEPVNAVTSLTYTIFGLVGIALRYNTTMYYLLMNLFILMGISSFLHHYCIIFEHI